MMHLTTFALKALAANATNPSTLALANPGVFSGAKAVLFINTVLVGPNILLSDLTQPAWTGYVPVAVVNTGPFQSQDRGAYNDMGLLSFVPGAAVDPEVEVLGYGLTDSGGTNLLGVEVFDTPINVTGVDTPVSFVPQFKLDAGNDYGDAKEIGA